MDDLGSLALFLGFVVALILYVIFWVRTLEDIQRSDLDPSSKGMWTLAILVFQVFGPIAWWFAGPGAHARER